MSKKLINSVSSCVDESIEGFVTANPGVCQLQGHRVILRSDFENVKANGRVAILTGGGSGHEPAFGGYVGIGMATGAVHGDIFVSPGPAAILAAIRALASPAGVLILLNNYTGDRLNFGIALERGQTEGFLIRTVTNAEDCALESSGRSAGRRGLAGIVLLIKIAGALSEQGKSIDEILAITQQAADSAGTLGVCLSPCSVPGSSQAMFTIAHDCMELGLGLHGEAGVKTIKMCSAKDTVELMIDHMTSTKNSSRINLEYGDEVAVLVNNLGAVSDLEINIIIRDILKYLERKLIRVCRLYANRFATSQEMAGISITIMILDEIRKQCLDEEARAAVWMQPARVNHVDSYRHNMVKVPDLQHSANFSQSTLAMLDEGKTTAIREATLAACESLMCSEQELNDLDTGCGDADCGSTLCKGAQAIKQAIESKQLPSDNLFTFFLTLADIVEQSMGGSSGALYSVLFTAAAGALKSKCYSHLTYAIVVDAISAGIQAVMKYGQAKQGDRTMLDSLIPVLNILQCHSLETTSLPDLLLKVTKAAESGSRSTCGMRAQAGRASYVGPEWLHQEDPGARAVALWTAAFSAAFRKFFVK